MKLNSEDLISLSKTAINAALAAGEIINSYAKKDIAINHKNTGSSVSSQIVTEVDHLSQDVILKHLLPTCKIYDLGLLAEETQDDKSRFAKDYFWCIDPLDGTLAFTQGSPGYAVSIALVSQSGISHLAVVYDPVNKDLYHAIKGMRVFYNQKQVTLEKSLTPPDKTINSGGAVMNACWVLNPEYESSYFFKKPKPQDGGGCIWDYAATACLFQELGLHVSDAYGNPLKLNRKDTLFMNKEGILFAFNEPLADQLIIKD